MPEILDAEAKLINDAVNASIKKEESKNRFTDVLIAVFTLIITGVAFLQWFNINEINNLRIDIAKLNTLVNYGAENRDRIIYLEKQCTVIEADINKLKWIHPKEFK